MIVHRIPNLLVGLGLLCAGPAAHAQSLGGGASPEVSLVRMVGALFVCLLLAFLAILYLKRRTGGALPPIFSRLVTTHPEIEVREVRRISVQHSVGLIRHGGEEYLLLLSPGDSLVLNRRPVGDLAPGGSKA